MSVGELSVGEMSVGEMSWIQLRDLPVDPVYHSQVLMGARFIWVLPCLGPCLGYFHYYNLKQKIIQKLWSRRRILV